MIEVKRLSPDRWGEYRDLRLEALQSDPVAFGSSYAEEKALTEDEWRKRMGNALFALSEGSPVGMIVCVVNERVKSRHIATIFGVYVRKDCRGEGVGRKLIEGSIKAVRENVDVSKIKLTVNPDQAVRELWF